MPVYQDFKVLKWEMQGSRTTNAGEKDSRHQ